MQHLQIFLVTTFMKEPMKQVSLEGMFQTMYKNDFNGTSTIKLNSRVMKVAKEVSSDGMQFL